MNHYEGGFTEHDIKLLYENHIGIEADIKVISRYRTVNGYMALVYLKEQHRILFLSNDFTKDKYELPLQICSLSSGLTELGAILETERIVHIIGAWGL